MRKDISPEDDLLLKSESWRPPKRGRTQLEAIKEAIFNMRCVKGFSFNAIKKFLAENGIKTSTGSLSGFCRSRFAGGAKESMKPEVSARIASLLRNDEQNKEVPHV